MSHGQLPNISPPQKISEGTGVVVQVVASANVLNSHPSTTKKLTEKTISEDLWLPLFK
jgi:hypothetical protein